MVSERVARRVILAQDQVGPAGGGPEWGDNADRELS